MKIPNHKSSFKKIQKWKKIEILLDPNSKPQKFFKKIPEMYECWKCIWHEHFWNYNSQLRCCCQSLSWISSEAKRVIAKQVHKVFLMPNVWVSSTRCSYAMIWKGLEMKSWCQIFESHKMQSKWFFCQIATLWTIYREIWKVNKSVSETSLLHSNSKLCYFVAI